MGWEGWVGRFGLIIAITIDMDCEEAERMEVEEPIIIML